jgi:hypothetical protein
MSFGQETTFRPTKLSLSSYQTIAVSWGKTKRERPTLDRIQFQSPIANQEKLK